MSTTSRTENSNTSDDDDSDNDTLKHPKQKIKYEYHNAALSEPTPTGIKRYIYHEHIQRTIDAPKQSHIYSELQLQELLTEAVAVYQMLYFIRNRNHRLCFISSYLDRLWHIDEFGHRNYWTGSNRFYYFYCHEHFNQEKFETALKNLFEKTKHRKICRANKTERMKVLIDIFNKINTSHVEPDL